MKSIPNHEAADAVLLSSINVSQKQKQRHVYDMWMSGQVNVDGGFDRKLIKATRKKKSCLCERGRDGLESTKSMLRFLVKADLVANASTSLRGVRIPEARWLCYLERPLIRVPDRWARYQRRPYEELSDT